MRRLGLVSLLACACQQGRRPGQRTLEEALATVVSDHPERRLATK